MKFKSLITSILISGAAISGLARNANSEVIYNGHTYSITESHGSWQEAETEAINKGGHLAAINDSNENEFLSGLINECYARGYFGGNNLSAAWIGLEYVEGEYNNPSSWKWSNGDEVNYWNPFQSDFNQHRGNHAYLLSPSHQYGPKLWGNNPFHDMNPDIYNLNFRGVIETDVPEPSSLALLIGAGLTGVGLTCRKGFFRKRNNSNTPRS